MATVIVDHAKFGQKALLLPPISSLPSCPAINAPNGHLVQMHVHGPVRLKEVQATVG